MKNPIMALITFLLFTGTASADQVRGTVYSPTPCTLVPANGDVCIRVIAPIEGTLHLIKGDRTYSLRSDSNGRFSVSVPPGTYSIKVVKASSKVVKAPLELKELVVSPRKLTVEESKTPQVKPIVITHRSSTATATKPKVTPTPGICATIPNRHSR